LGQKSKGFQPSHLIIFILSTVICTILSIISVQLVPVLAMPGASGLFLAAGFYVPFGLWFGIWGCLAGGISGFLLIATGTPLPLACFFFIGDFLEAFIPLIAFRALKLDISLRDPKSFTGFIVFGVIFGSVASALIGPAGVVVTAGLHPNTYLPTFVPWLIGDIIVIAVVGIPLLMALSPVIKKTRGYVKGYLS
jgi:integral membrane sensor domain MASE1